MSARKSSKEMLEELQRLQAQWERDQATRTRRIRVNKRTHRIRFEHETEETVEVIVEPREGKDEHCDLEQRVAKLEEFAADVRAYTQFLTDMIRRYDERLDEHAGLFRETDEKIAALADAQIQTERAAATVNEQLAVLVAAQTQLIGRVDKLTDAIERHAGDERAHEV
jgi:NTP pyrophosphatase (non-canonical NTP hydrolase)